MIGRSVRRSMARSDRLDASIASERLQETFQHGGPRHHREVKPVGISFVDDPGEEQPAAPPARPERFNPPVPPHRVNPGVHHIRVISRVVGNAPTIVIIADPDRPALGRGNGGRFEDWHRRSSDQPSRASQDPQVRPGVEASPQVAELRRGEMDRAQPRERQSPVPFQPVHPVKVNPVVGRSPTDPTPTHAVQPVDHPERDRVRQQGHPSNASSHPEIPILLNR